MEKAEKLGLNVEGVTFKKFDVTDPPSITAAALAGASSVICTIGFVPGNPQKWKQAAHQLNADGTGPQRLASGCGENRPTLA